MIKIQTLIIEEFRGIRRLDLELNSHNFAVYGPNGSGKSGVVDAIEFVLTGSISRLTGYGTAGISVKKHAPHVDHRDAPDFARVTLKGFAPFLNREFTLQRRVSNPDKALVTPDKDSTIEGVVALLQQHPEVALTRREIIKYILAAPGERARQVQALLRLDRLENIRQILTKIHNTAKTESSTKKLEVDQCQTQLLKTLGLGTLNKEDALRVINAKRATLGLQALPDIDEHTSLRTGITLSTIPEKQRVPKTQALSEVQTITKLLRDPEPATLIEARATVKDIADKLLTSPSFLQSLRRESFLRSGVDLIIDEACPFCDTQWNIAALKAHVNGKLAEAREASDLRNRLSAAAQPLSAALLELSSLAHNIAAYAKQLSSSHITGHLQEWEDHLRLVNDRLASLDYLNDTQQYIAGTVYKASEEVVQDIDAVKALIESIPDVSQEDQAKEFLTIAEERLKRYREARRQRDRCRAHVEIASKVLVAFTEATNAVLNKIYDDVEHDFTKYYQLVNEDESHFIGKLSPSHGSLDFNVDFYGRGLFPPGAYHSEGHQDSMGICLYLALMRHTHGKNFTFAVLDDVLMSIDKAHRRDICGMLKSEFPDTQFIITTHDEVWLHHMKTEQLISGKKSTVEFRKWTVETGPVVWEGEEAWEEINRDLDTGNVSGAAATLRRYLEYISAQLADKFRAKVEFRGDGRYELGDLLDSVLREWNSILAEAQRAAQSWANKNETEQLTHRQNDFKQKVAQSEGERWSINIGVHYNEWANLAKEDFAPVVNAFKDLLQTFRCSNCNSFLYIVPMRGRKEALRCDCGMVHINLRKK